MQSLYRYLAYAVIGIVVYYVYSFIDLEVRQRKKKARFAIAYPAGPLGLSFVKEMTALSTSLRITKVSADELRDIPLRMVARF